MLTRCLFCHAPFRANSELEHFPVGPRVVYDPARGRLWAVCRVCSRWNLAPIEERWEALEELEKLVRDRARLLVQTDNIGLLRAGELDIVRIGRAELREEAWWRYGRRIAARRALSWTLRGVELALAMAGGGLIASSLFDAGVSWLRFGNTAWRGEVPCSRCGKPMRRLSFSAAGRLLLVPGPDGSPALKRECPRCARRAQEGWLYWKGPDAERAIRRILAYQNSGGASRANIDRAVSSIAAAGSADALLARAAQDRPQIRQLRKRRHRVASLALEIAASEQTERRLLEMEATALELRWKEEEALAAISDGELTPLARLDLLVRRIRQSA